MPVTIPATKRESPQRISPLALLRDLVTTVALCYLITLGLLRCITLHLEYFAPTATCGADFDVAQELDYRKYQRAVANISRIDVLKVTTGCALVAFAAAEFFLALARRAGVPVDAEQGETAEVSRHHLSEKQRVDEREKSSLGSVL